MAMKLDDIRAAAEEKFASLDIEVGGRTVRLVNALQLPKEKRQALVNVQDRLSKDGEEAETEEVLSEAIRIVADSAEGAEALLEQVGDNLATLIQIFNEYNKGTQAGEA